jgi:hypothetical protein
MRALAKHFSGGTNGVAARTPVTSPRFPPPETFFPLRVEEFFDLPSGGTGKVCGPSTLRAGTKILWRVVAAKSYRVAVRTRAFAADATTGAISFGGVSNL